MSKLTRVSDHMATYTAPHIGSVSRLLEHRLDDVISVADYGAVGDGITNEKDAFMKAFDALRERGGGVLFVPAGNYDFGTYSKSEFVMFITDISNFTILAYGATFTVTTINTATPFLFTFKNCSNFHIYGAKFFDKGFDPSSWLTHQRWGMAAVTVQPSDTYHSGITLVDCEARNLTYFLLSDQATQATVSSQRRSFGDFTVKNCYVENAYYGIDLLYVGGSTNVEMRCKDVRRGFISYGQRNTTVHIDLYTSQGFFGSNAFISLACEGEGFIDRWGNPLGEDANVSNIKVHVTVSGYEGHLAYVRGYHQQADNAGTISNIDATVQINKLSTVGKNPLLGNTNAFALSHETPTGVIATTNRRFHNFRMDLQLNGTITGKPIDFESVNPTNKHLLDASQSLLNHSTDIDKARWVVAASWLCPMTIQLTGFTIGIRPIGTTIVGEPLSYYLDGYIRKEGKAVFISGRIRYASHTGTGQMRLNKLPFPIDSANTKGILRCSIVSGTRPSAGVLLGNVGGVGDAQIVLVTESTSGWVSYSVSPGNTEITFEGSYQTTY